MNTKKTILTMLAVIASVNAFAKIAVVNSQYILENSEVTKSMNIEIKDATKKAQEELTAKEEELMKKQEELVNKRAILKAEEYKKQEIELQKEVIAFRKEVKKIQQTLGIQNKQAMQEIAGKISEIVERIAKKEGYEIVMSKGLLMYSSDKIDITKQVIEELNKLQPSR